MRVPWLWVSLFIRIHSPFAWISLWFWIIGYRLMRCCLKKASNFLFHTPNAMTLLRLWMLSVLCSFSNGYISSSQNRSPIFHNAQSLKMEASQVGSFQILPTDKHTTRIRCIPLLRCVIVSRRWTGMNFLNVNRVGWANHLLLAETNVSAYLKILVFSLGPVSNVF